MESVFNTMKDMRQAFTRRQFVPEQSFNVEGINYHFQKSNNPPMSDVISKGLNMFMVYVIDPKRANQLYHDFASSKEQWKNNPDKPGSMIAFLWKWNPNINIIMPVNVRPTMPQRLNALELDRDIFNEQANVGLTTELTFVQLGKVVPAKVDTGATTSSLHAEQWAINGDRVVFKSAVFGDGTLTLPLEGTHDVHTSDGGVERRPIVALDIKVGEQLLKAVHFNLNNRSNMDFPVLLGQNALRQGEFTVDPSLENVQWDHFDKLFENDTFPEVPLVSSADYDQVKDAIAQLENSNVSLKDIARFIRTHALETLEY